MNAPSRGPERAEQRRPEQDAGDHLADHRRLPDRARTARPEQAAERDDDRERQQVQRD